MLDNLVYSLFDYFDKMPFIVSFIAGILSFLSPCVLPLIPIYFFYITGISATELENKTLTNRERVKIFIDSVLFILGFSFVFILIGASAANLIGNIFNNIYTNLLMAVIIILFGLHIAKIVDFRFLNYEKKLNLNNVGSFFLGVSFAFGWTPCIGPIFGTIIGIASTDVTKSVIMMILYALGLALPFLFIALFSVWSLKFINRLKKYLHIIEKISGFILILVGVYMIFKVLR